MDAMTHAHSLRARVTSDRWPACNAPIVGTNPTGEGSDRRTRRISATVATVCIETLRRIGELEHTQHCAPDHKRLPGRDDHTSADRATVDVRPIAAAQIGQ